MPSQNDEDRYIREAFNGYVGKFLDIGAGDGLENSNTSALIEAGWSGILVEPGPRSFIALQERYGANPKLTLINAAIRVRRGLVEFWESKTIPGLSTTEEGNRAKWADIARFDRPVYVAAMALWDVFQVSTGPIDFVDIDTEGTSVDILRAYPFYSYPPKVICVEHDGRTVECHQITEELGYKEVARNAENLILVR